MSGKMVIWNPFKFLKARRHYFCSVMVGFFSLYVLNEIQTPRQNRIDLQIEQQNLR